MDKVNSSLTFAYVHSCHRADESIPHDSLAVIISSFYFSFESSAWTNLDLSLSLSKLFTSHSWTMVKTIIENILTCAEKRQNRQQKIESCNASFACYFLDVQSIKDYTYWYVQTEQKTTRSNVSRRRKSQSTHDNRFQTRRNTPNRLMNFARRIRVTVTTDELNNSEEETVLI